jgi:nitroreductase
MFRDLVLQTRSTRRFDQSAIIPMSTVRELVDLARLTASAGNMQPLRYILSTNPAVNETIFTHLRWAAYLREWRGPKEGERPSAYIIITHDLGLTQSVDCDHGIAAQTILLGATELGLAGCIVGSINKQELVKIFQLPQRYEIMLVIALGKPREHIQLETVGVEANIKYWKDAQGVHHVPKRSLNDIVLSQFE